MNSNYKLADLISFINVAASQHLFNLHLKNCNTNLNFRILAILERQGVIRGFRISDNFINIYLKYKQGSSSFSSLKVVSTPGKRTYWKLNRLELNSNFLSFSGFYIISTSKGLLTSDEILLSNKISGEVLVKVEI